MVIMDDLFCQLPPLDPFTVDDSDYNLYIDLNRKELMDLDELDFDFEEINDLGSWLASSEQDIKVTENSSRAESERLGFEEFEIKEAVRYDCMWSGYNKFTGHKTVKTENDTSLTLSTSFNDSLLGSIDTPEISETDCISIKSEMETDEEKSTMRLSQLFTSLDHCYNISLDNERVLPRRGHVTPPVSSDDEESTNQANFNHFVKAKK